MKQSNFQKSKISREVNKALKEGFSIDTSRDKSLMENETYSWDDLTALKDELGSNILNFLTQVNGIVSNPTILSNLGDKKEHFEKVRDTFFNDLTDFSSKVKELRSQHEGRVGHVDDINEFNTYNRIAIEYHTLYSELSSLITPTLSELVLTVAEIVPPQKIQEIDQEEGKLNG